MKDGYFSGWSIIGAETIDNINNVAWKIKTVSYRHGRRLNWGLVKVYLLVLQIPQRAFGKRPLIKTSMVIQLLAPLMTRPKMMAP